MQYHLKTKPKSGKSLTTIVAFGLFFLLLLLSFIFPNATRSFVYTVSTPLWIVRDVVTKPFVSVTDFFRFKNTLIAENLALQDEVATLRLRQIDYDTVTQENQTLRNLSASTSATRVTSRVLSKPPQSPYDTLVIDVGATSGVAVGNNVYISDNIIVGFVASVTTNTSLIQMFSTGGTAQPATLSRTGESFVLVGKGGANFQVEVPKETDVIVGDTFLYSIMSSGASSGTSSTKTTSVLATVYYVDTNPQSSFKTIYARIPGNIFSTQWIFIER